jgi:hypothetical protein
MARRHYRRFVRLVDRVEVAQEPFIYGTRRPKRATP